MIKVHVISGGSLADDMFTITLQSGETVSWNVTKLERSAKAGEFGPPVYVRTSQIPPPRWETWDENDRKTVDWIKEHPDVLNDPAIAMQSENPDYLFSCFPDGQHRITARQELGLDEVSFYVVPLSMERRFRITGLS